MLALDGLIPGRPRAAAWYADSIAAGQILVALVDGLVAGFAVHHRHFFQRDFLDLLVVEPWCRRRGVATALLSAVESRCAGRELFASTNGSNSAMQSALRAWGFRATGRIDNIDLGDPEIIYLKRVGTERIP